MKRTSDAAAGKYCAHLFQQVRRMVSYRSKFMPVSIEPVSGRCRVTDPGCCRRRYL
jgi:hypothetical protein